MEPIKLFIGTSSNGEDADIEIAYEYSLRKNVSGPLEITWMRQTHDEDSIWGGWDTHHWSTPFSGYRWVIPEVCGFEGKAIYTDVDMINLHDIRDLWNTDLNFRACGARRGVRFGGHEFCVMVFDCSHPTWKVISRAEDQKKIPNTHWRHIDTFSGNEEQVWDLDPRWNCLDGDGKPIEEMFHLHYTNMATQPWRPAWYIGPLTEHSRPDLVKLYYDMVQEAKDAGYVPRIPKPPFGPYNIIGK